MLWRGVPLSDHERHALGGPHLRAASGLVSFKAWCRCGRILPAPDQWTGHTLHCTLCPCHSGRAGCSTRRPTTFKAGQACPGAQPGCSASTHHSVAAGALSGKGKIPYAILAIMDVIRHYPGQVPDLDAVLQTSDFPCMLASGSKDTPAPPLFGYNSHPTYTDIPFPDYSYWGHEYSHLLGTPPRKAQETELGLAARLPLMAIAQALLGASCMMHGHRGMGSGRQAL